MLQLKATRPALSDLLAHTALRLTRLSLALLVLTALLLPLLTPSARLEPIPISLVLPNATSALLALTVLRLMQLLPALSPPTV